MIWLKGNGHQMEKMESSRCLDTVHEEKGAHSVWENIVGTSKCMGFEETTKAQTEHIGQHRPLESAEQNSAFSKRENYLKDMSRTLGRGQDLSLKF